MVTGIGVETDEDEAGIEWIWPSSPSRITWTFRSTRRLAPEEDPGGVVVDEEEVEEVEEAARIRFRNSGFRLSSYW